MRGYKILSQEQIDQAKQLRKTGYTKKQLAILFEVGETTIWENVIDPRKRIRDRTIYFKRYVRKKAQRNQCVPCANCEICLTDELENNLPPLNYRVGNQCIQCFIRSKRHLVTEQFGDAEWLPDWLKEL